jgi:hypothetical protein
MKTDKILTHIRLRVYDQLLKSIERGDSTVMVNLFNTGIIIDVQKIGKKALETIIKIEKKRLNSR